MAVIAQSAPEAEHLFHESWTCGHCGREFDDATRCCAHEAQCGDMTHC